jgi:hypothetical protein
LRHSPYVDVVAVALNEGSVKVNVQEHAGQLMNEHIIENIALYYQRRSECLKKRGWIAETFNGGAERDKWVRSCEPDAIEGGDMGL